MDRAIESNLNSDLVTKPDASSLALGNLPPSVLIADREVVLDRAGQGFGEEGLQVGVLPNLPVHVLGHGRLDSEGVVPVVDVDPVQIPVGFLQRPRLERGGLGMARRPVAQNVGPSPRKRSPPPYGGRGSPPRVSEPCRHFPHRSRGAALSRNPPCRGTPSHP